MERLKKYLEDEGLTQAEFAKKLKVEQPTVSEWISGRTKPTADRLIDLSRITKISIDELLGHRAA